MPWLVAMKVHFFLVSTCGTSAVLRPPGEGVAYDPAEDGKEHIGDGVHLGDDPSFATPDSMKALEDPMCEEAPGWNEYRAVLLATMRESWEDAAAIAYEWMQQKDLFKTKVLDDAARDCLVGVVATLYLMARYTLETDGAWESAVYLSRTLDGYAAAMHPGKLDDCSDRGNRWPVTSAQLDRLRRRLSGASANRTDSDWKNGAGERYIGNAFGVLPSDEIEAGIRVADAFSVYVYEVDDYPELGVLASGAAFCRDNQWGFESAIHEWLLACPCRTNDPNHADFFFVPQYTACHLNVQSISEEESDDLFVSLVQNLQHFNRSRGRDHVFVFGGGFGVDGPFRSWRSHVADSIFLMAEPELWNPYPDISTPSFSVYKDFLVPGRMNLRDVIASAKATPPPGERAYLADFVGWNRPLHRSQGGTHVPSPRGSILAMSKEPDLHIRQDVPYAEAALGALNSRFCLVPRGKSAWSSRFFRVIFAGCVPVLLNDFYEPPFDALFDVSGFVARWPMKEVDSRFLDVLRAVPVEALEKMVAAAVEVRCWYLYPPSALDFEHVDLQKGKLDPVCPRWRTENAFVAVARQLRKRRRATRAAPPGFAFHMPDAQGKPIFFERSDA